MNDDRIAPRPIMSGPLVSFAAVTKRVGAAARASARIAPSLALRARSGALAGALRALLVPAASTRTVMSAAGARLQLEADGARPGRRTRSLAALLAPGSAGSSAAVTRSVTEIRNPRSAQREPGSAPRGFAPRVALSGAIAMPSAARAAFGAVAQFAWHANLHPRATGKVGAPREGVDPRELSRPHHVSFAAIVARGGAARGAGQAHRAPSMSMAREASEGTPEYRDTRRGPAVSAAIPARIRRAIERSRVAASSSSAQLPRVEREYSSNRTGQPVAVRGARRSADASAPITINSSPSITVNLPPGAAAPGERDIAQAVAQALEEHAERLYELMRRVGALRERAEF